MPELKDILGVTPLIAFFLICAWVALKALPSFKEVRMKELEIRKEEMVLHRELIASVSSLSGIFKKVSDTTDELKLVLRVTARMHEEYEGRLTTLERAERNIASDEKVMRGK